MLVERERETAEIERLIDDALDSEGRLLFLGGEAGIGKSTLVRHVVSRVRDRLSVRRGYADDVTTAAALGALLEAIPELAPIADDIAVQGKLTLFREAQRVLASEPTLLVLEDVHWADEATLDVVRYLGRRLAAAAGSQIDSQDLYERTSGNPFCLVDAPDAFAAESVHREAHGLLADEIHPVVEGD